MIAADILVVIANIQIAASSRVRIPSPGCSRDTVVNDTWSPIRYASAVSGVMCPACCARVSRYVSSAVEAVVMAVNDHNVPVVPME